MAAGLNERNQTLHLARVPEGDAVPDDFEVRESAVPQPKDGEILIRNQFVGVDAALRLIVRDSSDFLFRVRPGDPVHGSAAGSSRATAMATPSETQSSRATKDDGLSQTAAMFPKTCARSQMNAARKNVLTNGSGLREATRRNNRAAQITSAAKASRPQRPLSVRAWRIWLLALAVAPSGCSRSKYFSPP